MIRYVDQACAWTILLTAVSFILVTEVTHPRGAILDIPLLWLIVAMLNFLRLRNGHSLAGLKIACVGANLVALTLETVRLKLFGTVLLRYWGSYSAIIAVAVLGETIFSLTRKDDSTSPTRV